MIVKTNVASLYGKRLKNIPIDDLNPPELAKLYAYLVQEHGENSPLVLDPIKALELLTVETHDEIYEEGKEEGYDDGYSEGMTACDDRYDSGYDEGYEDAKKEYGAGE